MVRLFRGVTRIIQNHMQLDVSIIEAKPDGTLLDKKNATD